MKNNPFISIIVPVYNKEKYVSACIDSLVKQTYKNVEVILVDDESIDDSGRICDRYAAEYGNVSVIHKTNGGPSSAWKAGFRESTGEYIVFVDSDDYIDVTMIEEMADSLSGIEKEIITSDYAITKEDGSETYVYQAILPGEYLRKDIVKDIAPQLLGNEQRYISFSRCMKLISRKLVEDNIDFCDERVLMGDDSTIILPCLLDAERILVMDHRVFYHYRYINDSVVHRYDANAFENNKMHYNALKNMLCTKYGQDNDMLQVMLKQLDREEIFLLLLVVKNEVRGNSESCVKNLNAMRKDSFVTRIVDGTDVSISDKANRLLYLVLKNPNAVNVGILKLAFKVYYRK